MFLVELNFVTSRRGTCFLLNVVLPLFSSCGGLSQQKANIVVVIIIIIIIIGTSRECNVVHIVWRRLLLFKMIAIEAHWIIVIVWIWEKILMLKIRIIDNNGPYFTKRKKLLFIIFPIHYLATFRYVYWPASANLNDNYKMDFSSLCAEQELSLSLSIWISVGTFLGIGNRKKTNREL